MGLYTQARAYYDRSGNLRSSVCATRSSNFGYAEMEVMARFLPSNVGQRHHDKSHALISRLVATCPLSQSIHTAILDF